MVASIANTALRVRCYYRMSTDDQTTSIEQQRKECRAHAARLGWEIIGEHDDPGKSGLLPWEKRPGFVGMLAACKKGDCNAILVWHSSRFGRADSLDAAEPKRILRKLGIWLETLREGRIDWNTKHGRTMDFMLSEQNNDYVQGLSASVVRGQNSYADAGWRTVGNAPYGYDREYCDEAGNRQMIVPRTDHFRSPRTWRMKLIVNEAEADVVRFIFREFVKGSSATGIARALNVRGVAVPYRHRPTKRMNRGCWGDSTVKDILKNRAYVGTYVTGVDHAKDGMNRLGFRERKNHPSIPPLIDADTFAAAAKLREAKKLRKIRPRTGGGPLNGVLLCGCCGFPLYRKVEKSGKARKEIAYYTCKHGSENPALKCKAWRAREDVVLPVVLDTLVRTIDFETLKALEAKPPQGDDGEVAGLERRRAELSADIEVGTQNLLRANARTFPLLQAKLDQLQVELDGITNAVALATVAEPEAERRGRLEWLRSVKGRLVTVVDAEGLADACPHPGRPSRHVLDVIETELGSPPAEGTVYVDGEPWTVEVDPEDGRRTYWEYERPAFDVAPDGRKLYRLPNPAVQVDAGALRSLLLTLGVKVSLTWVPNGTYRFKLQKAEITCDAGDSSIATFATSGS